MTPLVEVDRLGDPQESLAQRAKQQSSGGTMVVYPSKNSSRVNLSPMWSEGTALERAVEPAIPEGSPVER